MRGTFVIVSLVLALTGCTGDGPTLSRSTAGPVPSASASEPTTTPSPAPVEPTTPAPTPEDPLSPAPALESPAPIGQPTCKAQNLTVVDADAVITTTAVQEVFVVRTTGAACQLEGWPAVRLLRADGSGMTLAVRHGGYGLPPEQPKPVTLDPATTLSFVVATSRKGTCEDAATLVVTLPGTTASRRAATTLTVCGAAVGVSPVHRNVDEEAGEG